MVTPEQRTSQQPLTEQSVSPDADKVILSDELFQGRRAVQITHQGQQYRLLITKNDKLILQK